MRTSDEPSSDDLRSPIVPPGDSDTDADLVRRWQAGVADAGTRLLRRHEHALRRYFKARFDESADDLVQQTLLACTQSVGRIQEADKFPSFLMGVARRISMTHLRNKRVRTDRQRALSHEPEPTRETPSRVASLRQRRGQLMRAVRRLPPEWQLAVVLHYWHGLSVAEVAAVQDVAEGTVKSWLARSRARLRRKLTDLLPEPQS